MTGGVNGLKLGHEFPVRFALIAYADPVQYCSPLEGRTSTMKIALMTTYDGRKYRMLNVIDEFTHECLAICINRKLEAVDVIHVLSDLFILRGVPGHIRSDNGPEFVAKAAREWIAAVGASLTRLQTTSTGGVCARIRRVAGFATSTGSAGQLELPPALN